MLEFHNISWKTLSPATTTHLTRPIRLGRAAATAPLAKRARVTLRVGGEIGTVCEGPRGARVRCPCGCVLGAKVALAAGGPVV